MKNKGEFVKAINNSQGLKFMSLLLDNKSIKAEFESMPSKGFIFDITPFFRDEEQAHRFSLVIENLVNLFEENWSLYFIVDKRYSYIVKDLLFYKISSVKRFESELGIPIAPSNNIVQVSENRFKDILQAVNEKLIGHSIFKERIALELRKYRVFNQIGYMPIFSMLICGDSGIGKTEVARILHQELSPEEPFIKINFGNYSDHNALSSLIGSPRGYVGSNKGELSDKLNNSKSTIILIDEFEKCDKQVQNFFLQLLEDGVFTDSLGRDYDLNRYIIVFTANLKRESIPNIIPPELLSRFNLKYNFSSLKNEEKKLYVKHRTNQIIKDLKNKEYNVDQDRIYSEIGKIDVTLFSNMRDINNEIMKHISDTIYEDVVDLS